MKKMLALHPGCSEPVEIEIIRIVRVVSRPRCCGRPQDGAFDLAMTLDGQAWIREAGYDDKTPWRKEVLHGSAQVSLELVSSFRPSMDEPIPPDEQLVAARLARATQVRVLEERRKRLGEEVFAEREKERLEKEEQRTGKRKKPWEQKKLLGEDDDSEGFDE